MADGTPIAIWRSGAGRPLVLVHGATADHARWATAAPRCWRPRSTPLHGGSPGPRHPAATPRSTRSSGSTRTWSPSWTPWPNQWGGPVDLLGHSYGALCALEAALRRPTTYDA